MGKLYLLLPCVWLLLCVELIYKEVISYESPERHIHTRATANSVHNHTSAAAAMNHNPGTI